MRSDMLALYAETGDWKAARPFVSIHRTSKVNDFCFGMDVLLELGELKAAETLATRCRKLLRFVPDRFQQSIPLRALGDFFSRTHRWDKALAVWEAIPLEQPFRRNVLNGIVEIHLARALEATRRGLDLLSELKKNPDMENEVCLPNNDVLMTQEAEKELLQFQRSIDTLLPQKMRQELGISLKGSSLDQSFECLACAWLCSAISGASIQSHRQDAVITPLHQRHLGP
jgi:hypothetical protein